MTLIIALMFIALKVKELTLFEKKESNYSMWLISLFFGFLSFSVMYNQLEFEGMLLDLREVPLFFISYIGGWKWGVISSVLPLFYRFLLGGPTVVQGIGLSILLPVLLGSLFHLKTVFKHPIIIKIPEMMIGCTIFEIVKFIGLYLTTPITIPLILAMFFFASIAVLAMGLMVNDNHQNISLRKELEILSNHDPLTQLPNIRYFKKNVETLMAKQSTVTISMVDVDYFKNYNDTHGHQKGDHILKTVGLILKENVRVDDFVARYGGEEFIICFSNEVNQTAVYDIVERIRKAIEVYTFEGEEHQPDKRLTISIGISSTSKNKTLEQLIKEADDALYTSKKVGRNQITEYGSGI
ncbi:GGDEF domain-containing protein [Paenisporosarcina sp. NPDC076898]